MSSSDNPCLGHRSGPFGVSRVGSLSLGAGTDAKTISQISRSGSPAHSARQREMGDLLNWTDIQTAKITFIDFEYDIATKFTESNDPTAEEITIIPTFRTPA